MGLDQSVGLESTEKAVNPIREPRYYDEEGMTRIPVIVFLTAYLPCLLVAGRYQGLRDLLALYRNPFWHYRHCGVKALLVNLGQRVRIKTCTIRRLICSVDCSYL